MTLLCVNKTVVITHSGWGTVCVGIITLLVFFSGCILRLPIWGDPADDNCFDDEPYWEVRDDSLKPLRGFLQFRNKKVNIKSQVIPQKLWSCTEWMADILKITYVLMISSDVANVTYYKRPYKTIPEYKYHNRLWMRGLGINLVYNAIFVQSVLPQCVLYPESVFPLVMYVPPFFNLYLHRNSSLQYKYFN